MTYLLTVLSALMMPRRPRIAAGDLDANTPITHTNGRLLATPTVDAIIYTLPEFPCSFNLNTLPSFISLTCRSSIPRVVPSTWEPSSLLPSLLLELISILSRSDYGSISLSDEAPPPQHSQKESFPSPGELCWKQTLPQFLALCMQRKLSRPRPSSNTLRSLTHVIPIATRRLQDC